MRMILRSMIINSQVCYNALNNCSYKHNDLIWHYWDHDFRDYIQYNLYRGNNQISKESIVEALTK